MVKEAKIKALSNEIRRALPYLMELSEGCLIEDTSISTTYKVSCLKKSLSGERIDIYGIDLNNKFCLRGFILKSYHKIIGHEINLNDVLAWLAKVKEDRGVLITAKGEMCFYDDEILNLFIMYNLENPYLKDQSEELINFLYSLIQQ